MKAQILKMSGCKTEKQFYDKFPSEEAFMKVHGKAFKKAMLGAKITSADNGAFINKYQDYTTPNYMSPKIGQQVTLNNQPSLQGATMSPRGGGLLPVNLDNTLKSNGGDNVLSGGGGDILGSLGKMINPAEKLAQGISSLIQEGKQRRKAEQWEDVSDLQLQASMIQPEQSQRRYVRPEDMMNQLNNSYGNNTNVLGKNGISIKKKAANGFSDVMNAGGTDIANNLVSRVFNNNAGYQIGSSVGDAVSMIPGIGPVVGAIASPVLGAIGGALDPNLRKTKKAQENTYRNIENMAFSKGMQNQYTSFMEDGGNLNPQVIKSFGMRTGGNIKQNEVFPQDRFAMGGELQAYEGKVEPISYNPYLPDGGETVMFRGPSHEEGGMDITYGKNPVEVEGNEPAVKLEDGGGADNLVVFGNLPIPKFGKALLGDKDATGKFKNYIANLSKKEDKANKVISSSTGKIGEVDMNSSFDKLTLASHKANIMGADMNLKEIADKKTKASILQEAMNMVKDGNTAKNGASIPKAYEGIEESTYFKFPHQQIPLRPDFKYDPTLSEEDNKWEREDNYYSNLNIDYWNKSPNEFHSPRKQVEKGELLSPRYIKPETKGFNQLMESNSIDVRNTEKEDNKFPWMQLINSALPYFRPSDAENLDARQLMGESFALSNNQLEPVQAQTYNPQLDNAYDVSLQDIRNENQADYRAAQRMMGGNPAAQAILNAQKYAANQKVGGEEFRLNQALKDKVFSGNRATLNDAQLKNLGIYDNQYTRQEQAKANTKAVTQAALNSVSDKHLKNQLENRTLQAYENLYNYRYDNQGRAINMNPLAQFNTEGATTNSNKNTGFNFAPGYEGEYDGQGRLIGTKVIKKTKSPVDRNGGIVKAMKNL